MNLDNPLAQHLLIGLVQLANAIAMAILVVERRHDKQRRDKH